MRAFLGGAAPALIPFFAFAIGSSLNLTMLWQAGLLGIALGSILVFHRSTWMAVIAHGTFNATSFALIPMAMEAMKALPK